MRRAYLFTLSIFLYILYIIDAIYTQTLDLWVFSK